MWVGTWLIQYQHARIYVAVQSIVLQIHLPWSCEIETGVNHIWSTRDRIVSMSHPDSKPERTMDNTQLDSRWRNLNCATPAGSKSARADGPEHRGRLEWLSARQLWRVCEESGQPRRSFGCACDGFRARQDTEKESREDCARALSGWDDGARRLHQLSAVEQ